MTSNNPLIPRPLFITFIAVAVILTAGASLFFNPGLFGPHWPWLLKPFHARFLGALYTAEFVTVLFTVIVPRWSPARLSVPQSVAFAGIVSAASFLQFSQFNFSRPIVWIWFVLYILTAAIIAYYWWPNRNLQAPERIPLSMGWRGYLLAQGFVLGIYGLGLFLLPATASAFWPWTIDAFHAQIYSAIFLTGAVGAWMLYKSASRLELMMEGLTQAAFGALSIAGLLIVDGTVHKVNWSAPGTWIWLAALAWLAVSGIAIAWRGWRPQVESHE